MRLLSHYFLPHPPMNGNTGVDYPALYLNDQIHEGHPMFEDLHRMYGPTPEGQRLQKFWDQNDMYLDSLERQGPGQLDMIMNQEGVTYTGDVFDRIKKIQTIRKHRDDVEETMLDGMDKAGQIDYLAKKKAKQEMELASRLKLAEDQPVIQKKIGKARALAIQREKYIADRQKQRDEHRRLAQAQGDMAAARAGNFQHPLSVDQVVASAENAVINQKPAADAANSSQDNTTAPAAPAAPTGAVAAPRRRPRGGGNIANLNNAKKTA